MIFQEGSFTIMDLTKAVKEKYKKPLASCTNEEIYICLLEQVKKLAKEKEAASKITAATSKRKLYYISAEFLIGKLLSNNLINLGLYDEVKKELAAAGKSLAEIEELEPEPSLGNGGLGRLAACFVDSIATLGSLTRSICSRRPRTRGWKTRAGLPKPKTAIRFRSAASRLLPVSMTWM